MADLEQMKKALRAAHAAGDTAGAKRIAAMIKAGSASPMQQGLSELSAMTQKPSVAPSMDGPMLPPPADQRAMPKPEDTSGYRGFLAGVDQFGGGLNEGIASFAGAPVDLMTGALNLGGAGVNALFGTELPAIENPAGGSGTFAKALDPITTDMQPQTGPQRYLRRGGQELGFGIPAAMTGAALPGYGAAAREALVPYMAASTASDAGAAVAGQTSQELVPDSPVLNMIASLLGGGGTAYAASKMTPAIESVPSLDDLKAKASDAWQRVKAAPETLTDNATAGLSGAVKAALPDGQLAAEAYPKAYGMAEKMDTLQNPTIYDAETARRMIGDRVAASPDEARAGVQMKRAIEDYLGGLKPADLQGGTADETLDALATARKTTHQTKKADAILNAEMRAETRAATTGTGGNEVNATRQNVRAIFDKQRDPTLSGKRSGYTPDEMAAMETVVKGDAPSNIARLLSRMAPSSGALPLAATGYGGALGIGSAGMTGNPMYALPALAGGIGEVSKALAEKMTKDQIAALMATVLNGGRAPAKSAARTATQQAIVQQLMSTLATSPQ